MRGNGLKMHQRRLGLDVTKNLSEKAAQGGGEVTVPGDIQGTGRCHIQGQSLVSNISARWMVGLDDLRGIF